MPWVVEGVHMGQVHPGKGKSITSGRTVWAQAGGEGAELEAVGLQSKQGWCGSPETNAWLRTRTWPEHPEVCPALVDICRWGLRQGPWWGGPTHHLPSPFILGSLARCPSLPPAVGGWLSASPPCHPGHLVHGWAEETLTLAPSLS